MIKAEELQAWHIDQIIPKAIHSGENIAKLHGIIGRDDLFAAALVDGDVVLAIVGGNVIWEGVAHAWAFISDSVKTCPIAFHKEIQNLIHSTFTGMNMHRIEFTVRADYEMGIRWALALGFEDEGTLYFYGPDKAHYKMFARYN